MNTSNEASSSSSAESKLHIFADKTANSFATRSEAKAMVWTIGFFALLAVLFLTKHYTIGGVAVLALGAYRSVISVSTLCIARTKRTAKEVSIDHPCLIRFSASEGYPGYQCYLTAYRLASAGANQFCMAFPVRMDNVVATAAEGAKRLSDRTPEYVYSHPLRIGQLFVHARVSFPQKMELAFRGIAWATLAAIGVFLASVG